MAAGPKGEPRVSNATRGATLRFPRAFRVSGLKTLVPDVDGTRPSTRPSTRIRYPGGLARVGTISEAATPGVIIVCERGILVCPAPYPAVRATRRAQLVAGGVRRLWATLVRHRPRTLRNLPRTFTEVDFFDRHRVDDGCRSPASLGMIKDAKSGVWQPRAAPAKRRRAG